jgi:geranylgeranyl diphosphate synthase type II
MVQTPAAIFVEYANQVRSEIESALTRYTEYDADCPSRLREAMRHSLLAPGKRLRALLVLMAAEACGCTREAAMPAAAAVEMVHAYSLVHDDLPAMDDDALRRGLPTCHIVFGEALAILAGDALLARAFEVLASGLQPASVAARCCAELGCAAGASGLVGGQSDDLASQFAAGDLRLLEHIHRRKTGALIGVSLKLGALAAQAAATDVQCLDVYGRKLGLAFQIVDDLLDIHGNESDVGKRTGKDRDRGKLTFPSLLGIAESNERARQLVIEACEAIESFAARGNRLAALAHFVVERDR